MAEEIQHQGRKLLTKVEGKTALDVKAIEVYAKEVEKLLRSEFGELEAIMEDIRNVERTLWRLIRKLTEDTTLSGVEDESDRVEAVIELFEHLKLNMEELELKYISIKDIEKREVKYGKYVAHFIKHARNVFKACEKHLKAHEYID